MKKHPAQTLKSTRRAKIVATLGPLSNSVETVSKLIEAGANIFRLNMGHGDYDLHRQTIKNVREASKLVRCEVGVLVDLQGPKIRVGLIPEPLHLEEDSEWFLVGDAKNMDPQTIPSIYEAIVSDCRVGDRVLFDDGNIQAKVLGKSSEKLKIKITEGGTLKPKKGINLPDTALSISSFTPKDLEDVKFGMEEEVDYFALSFVQNSKDVLTLRQTMTEILSSKGSQERALPIISKIESPEGVKNLDEIIEASDAIMVARGDLGVEVGNHRVPGLQKQIITKCNHVGKPVVTATQMLESMMSSSTPTRAEASDVANAIWDGTDAVMLSGETAVGDFPVETVEMMDAIIKDAEKMPKERPLLRHMDLSKDYMSSLMIASSVIAEKTQAKLILAFTEQGRSCLLMSRFKSRTRVLGLTNSRKVMRKMSLYWGVTPVYLENLDIASATIEREIAPLIAHKFPLKAGDRVVISRGGGDSFAPGTTNSVRIVTIES